MVNTKTFFFVAWIIFILAMYFSTQHVFAHEAYVLDQNYFWMVQNSQANPIGFAPIQDSTNLKIGITIAVSVIIGLTINFFFRQTKISRRIGAFIERFSDFGPVIIRIAIAVSFFQAARSMNFLGPELPFGLLQHSHWIEVLLYCASFLLFFGFFTEIAACIGLLLFAIAVGKYGTYMFTYIQYVAELLVLLLFGTNKFSVDAFIFPNAIKRFNKVEPYATTIIRVGFGLAFIYTAISVKFLHPELTIHVIDMYALTQFHWLFPSDPMLITFGAGIVEIVIGLFIIFGFELRLTLLVMLFYLTLSISFFNELVWPHYILYGTALGLFFEREIFSVDHIVLRHHRKQHSWGLRPFLPYRHKHLQ